MSKEKEISSKEANKIVGGIVDGDQPGQFGEPNHFGFPEAKPVPLGGRDDTDVITDIAGPFRHRKGPIGGNHDGQ